MRFVSKAFLATTILMSSTTLANADVKVIASIKPVHSLVAAVMDGVGKPDLLVEGAGSPHTYSLKPSQAKKLQEADLVHREDELIEALLGLRRQVLLLDELLEDLGQRAVRLQVGQYAVVAGREAVALEGDRVAQDVRDLAAARAPVSGRRSPPSRRKSSNRPATQPWPWDFCSMPTSPSPSATSWRCARPPVI